MARLARSHFTSLPKKAKIDAAIKPLTAAAGRSEPLEVGNTNDKVLFSRQCRPGTGRRGTGLLA